MAVEGSIQALLKTLVSNRCYAAGEVPDTPTAPYIVFQMISTINQTIHSSPTRKKRLQIDIYASGYDAAKALETSAVSAMNGATFTNCFIVARDAFDQDVKLNRQIIDYHVWE